MNNKEYAKALRLMAKIYKYNPELPQINELKLYPSGIEQVRLCIKSLDNIKKNYDSHFIRITGTIGGIRIEAVDWREVVCTKRVVGTRLVKREIPIETKIVEVEEEIVEWDCNPILGDSK